MVEFGESIRPPEAVARVRKALSAAIKVHGESREFRNLSQAIAVLALLVVGEENENAHP